MLNYPYALQLYSVRDYFEHDITQALRKVHAAGYTYVELAGDYGFPPVKLREMLLASKLIAVSMHVGYDILVDKPREVIRNAHLLNLRYVVVPWLGGEFCPTREKWLEAITKMDNVGRMFSADGLQLCYHNHAHEFTRLGSDYIFDLIFENSHPNNLKVQLDLCWASVGNADLKELLQRYQGRIPLVHVKDYKHVLPTGQVEFAEVGRGILDWHDLLPAAKAYGVRWFIIEQDVCAGDSMESAAISAMFMKQFNGLNIETPGTSDGQSK